MYFFRIAGIVLFLTVIAGCGDNLFPSGDDQRPPVVAGSTGFEVGQKAADFTVKDINGNDVTLSAALAGKKGAVFYFTMWCSICDNHMSHMQAMIVPNYPDVGFYLVDYVSGSVADAAAAATASGYAGGVFSVLADTGHVLTNGLQGTMGTTVIIDSTGIIKMNEDYKDGVKVQSVLSALP